jgi:hypothetical protein
MTVPHLHRHADQFVERNLFLHALLGLVSIGDRFEAFFRELTARDDGAESGESSSPGSEVYLVLGALSLFRRVRSEIADWAQGASVDDPRADPTRASPRGVSARPRRDLLR